MPELQLKGGKATYLILSDIAKEEVEFVITACAPSDIIERAETWYLDNPVATPKELGEWMQGKNWGVVIDHTAVILHRKLINRRSIWEKPHAPVALQDQV